VPGSGGRSGAGRADRLDPWLLVVRDDGEALARLSRPWLSPLSPWARSNRHLTVDAEDFGHLGLELRIAFFPVIAHLVRLDPRARPRSCRPSPGPASPGSDCQQTPRAHGHAAASSRVVHSSWGITQLLRLSARQRHQPGFRLGGDNRIASCPRPIITAPRLRPVPPLAPDSVSTVCCVTPIVRATA